MSCPGEEIRDDPNKKRLGWNEYEEGKKKAEEGESEVVVVLLVLSLDRAIQE